MDCSLPSSNIIWLSINKSALNIKCVLFISCCILPRTKDKSYMVIRNLNSKLAATRCPWASMAVNALFCIGSWLHSELLCESSSDCALKLEYSSACILCSEKMFTRNKHITKINKGQIQTFQHFHHRGARRRRERAINWKSIWKNNERKLP